MGLKTMWYFKGMLCFKKEKMGQFTASEFYRDSGNNWTTLLNYAAGVAGAKKREEERVREKTTKANPPPFSISSQGPYPFRRLQRRLWTMPNKRTPTSRRTMIYGKEPNSVTAFDLFTFFRTDLIQSEASWKLSSTSDWLMSAWKNVS